MKHLKKTLGILVFSCWLVACNDNASGTDHSLDNTDNDDTQVTRPAKQITDSITGIDTLRGR